MPDPRTASPRATQAATRRWGNSAWERHALAVAAVVVATLLTFAVRPATQGSGIPIIFPFYYVAVFVAVWYAGRGPSLLAIALSVVIADSFFLPAGLFAPDLSGLIPTVFFVGISVLAVLLIERSRHAETEARLSQESLETTLKSIGDAVISTDAAGRVVFMNAVAERLTRWPLKDARGRPLREVFHIVNEHTRAEVESPVEKVLREGQVVGLANHTVLVARDGTEVPIDDSGAPIHDEQGRVGGVVLVFHDITERRKAEAERALLASIVESSGDAIISKTLDGTITSWNAAAEAMYGYTAEEAVGQHISLVVPPELYEELEGIMSRLRRGERVERHETVRVRKGGERLDVSVTISPVRDASGKWVGASTIARDITEHKRADAALQRRSRLIELSFEPILLWEFGGGIVEWNTGAEQLYGYTKTEATGRSSHELLKTVFSVPFDEYRAALEREGEWAGELRHTTKDGREVVIESRQQFSVIDGRRLVLETNHDITERKRAEEERARLLEREREARRQAEEVNRAKDEFLATLSHELRTPLTPILGWTHMIRSGMLGEQEAAQGIAVIEKNSQLLSRLISDLLDMSSILSGKMRIERAPVELGSVVREAFETVRPLADSRRVALEVQTGGLSHVIVGGDRTRLVQVFWNLLSNAIKFSREGGRVVVRLASGEGRARVEVADDGEGIEPEFLPHVFERFRQADMATTRAHGGLGIGLALVKSFVEAHGGSVEVSSDGEGRGSVFAVTLPAVAVASAANGDDEKRRAQECAEDVCRVLLVEDSRDTLEMLRIVFESRGHAVVACESAEDALRVAEAGRFDIIVSDIGLPRIDGYELIGRLRSLPHLRGVPAVALTGYAGPRDAEAARAAGYDAHVPKPVDPSALAEQVAQLVKRDARGAA
jgi:PAS domain S-box-containing protein